MRRFFGSSREAAEKTRLEREARRRAYLNPGEFGYFTRLSLADYADMIDTLNALKTLEREVARIGGTEIRK